MKFVRTYIGGAPEYDPRHKKWAVYHCDVCGEDTDIDVTRVMNTFDFNRSRKCPECSHTDIENKKESIKKQIEKLTEEKCNIEIRIEQLIQELSKEEVKIDNSSGG